MKTVNRTTAATELHVGDKVKLEGEGGPYTITAIRSEGYTVALEFGDRPCGNDWYVGGPAATFKMEAPKAKAKVGPMTRTVLKHLKQAGSITQVEASAMYRVRQLPYQIKALREAGYDIESEYKTDPVNKQRYVRYHLRQPAALEVAA